MSFELARYFHISPFSFDSVDYFEFLHQIEKMVIERKKQQNPNSSLQQLLQGDIQ